MYLSRPWYIELAGGVVSIVSLALFFLLKRGVQDVGLWVPFRLFLGLFIPFELFEPLDRRGGRGGLAKCVRAIDVIL